MGEEGEGSGVKGGGKWGLSTPLSTPSSMVVIGYTCITSVTEYSKSIRLYLN